MAERSIGQIREVERYSGDPTTRGGARARKSLDDMLTSDKNYMDDALKDTGRLLNKVGQRNIERHANKEIRKQVVRRTVRGGSR